MFSYMATGRRSSINTADDSGDYADKYTYLQTCIFINERICLYIYMYPKYTYT
jgi:hypothetical protein